MGASSRRCITCNSWTGLLVQESHCRFDKESKIPKGSTLSRVIKRMGIEAHPAIQRKGYRYPCRCSVIVTFDVLEVMRDNVDHAKFHRFVAPFLSQVARFFWIRHSVNCVVSRHACKECVAKRGRVPFEFINRWFNNEPQISSEIVHFASPSA